MKLKAPTNWDPDLLPALADLGVTEVYGKASRDVVGGGRPIALITDIGVRAAFKQIAAARRLGLRFDYLLNGISHGDREVTRSGHRAIVRFLRRLVDAGATSVTVSTPTMVRLTRTHAPSLEVNLGIFGMVESPHDLARWEELGVDSVTLHGHHVVRDFPMLRAIRAATSLQLQLVANNGCLYHCPYDVVHAVKLSQASEPDGGFFLDECFFRCRLLLLRDPVEAIKATWIRPEDTALYEEVGIDRLKLVDRMLATEHILSITRAYTAHRFDGDLTDLVPTLKGPSPPLASRPTLRHILNPLKVNPLKFGGMRDLMDPALALDNRALDGFLQPFVDGMTCHTRSCDECGYCAEVAASAVRVDEGLRQAHIRELEARMRGLEDGSLFGR